MSTITNARVQAITDYLEGYLGALQVLDKHLLNTREYYHKPVQAHRLFFGLFLHVSTRRPEKSAVAEYVEQESALVYSVLMCIRRGEYADAAKKLRYIVGKVHMCGYEPYDDNWLQAIVDQLNSSAETLLAMSEERSESVEAQ